MKVAVALQSQCVLCPQSRVLGSSRSLCVSPEGVLRQDLSSLLSVLAHTESALQWQQKELQVSHIEPRNTIYRRSDVLIVCLSVCGGQGAELSLRQLAEDKSSLQLRLKQLEDNGQQLLAQRQHTQLELTHTMDMLNRYTHTL